MNGKIMVLSENSFLKEGLWYEIEKLGFKTASSLSELSSDDILVVDIETASGYDYSANKIVYILPNGADITEYQDKFHLIRPFSMLEFNNLIFSLSSNSEVFHKSSDQTHGLSVTLSDSYIVMNGEKIELTKNEMLIFAELWRHKGRAVSREQLDGVIGATGDGNIVTVYINHLREKFSAVSEKRIIKTIRGGGYIISEA